MCWGLGSLASRHLPSPRSALLGVSMQMLCGGALLLVLGLAMGEGARFHPAAVTGRSLLALAYLITFGSILAFSCYVWLLKVVAPSTASTYAFVNPVIAVFLGAWLAAEPLTPRIFVSATVIVASVALITLARVRPGHK
jgi:drug/metabolite transporter (DMT)-like permease